jgi:hypothetical protein
VKTWGSAASVIAALRDDAAAEMARLERESDAAVARAGALPAPAGPAAPSPRVPAARRAAADLLADEDWQDTIAAAEDREAWMAGVVARGRAAAAAAPDALAWTAALAREAIARLPGTACIVTVPEALVPAAADAAWRGALERSAGRAITIEGGAFAAGCIARTTDGRVAFDNRAEAREARTATRWRAALARVYESAVADAAVPEPV